MEDKILNDKVIDVIEMTLKNGSRFVGIVRIIPAKNIPFGFRQIVAFDYLNKIFINDSQFLMIKNLEGKTLINQLEALKDIDLLPFSSTRKEEA